MRTPHIRRRDGRYLWRRRIPLPLVEIIGRTEFVFSLRTEGRALALIRARRLDVVADRLFMMLDQGTTLSRQQIQQLAQQWFREALEEEEASVIRSRYADGEDVDWSLVRARTLHEGARNMLSCNDLSAVWEHADALLNDAGVTVKRKEPLYRELCRLILRALVEVTRHGLAWREGDHSVAPVDQIFAVRDELPPAAEGRLGTAPAPPPEPQPPALPFSHFIPIYVSERVSNSNIQVQTQHQIRARASMFHRLVGDKPITEYGRSDVLAYRDLLVQLPDTLGKSPKDASRPLAEIIAREGPRLSRETAKKHFETVVACFRTAARHHPAYGLYLDALFEGIEVGGEAPEKRNYWQSNDLIKLFGSPVWRGRKGRALAASYQPGPHLLRDALFWLPLIAIYSGLRLEEIAKLRAADIFVQDGVTVIDLNEVLGRLKSRNSFRLVPIHPELVRMGLVDLAAGLPPDARLFPDLVRGGVNLKFGHNFSRDFSRYRKQVDVYKRWQDFHSFRHTFASALYDACNKDLLLVARVCGHTPQELSEFVEIRGLDSKVLKVETPTYIHGTLKDMDDAIGRVAYPGLDLSHLHLEVRKAAE